MDGALAIVVLLGICAWAWHSNAGAREIADAVTRRTCRELGLQRLDDSLTLRGIRLRLWQRRRVVVFRRFGFEFSTNGADRRRGEVGVFGSTAEWVRLEHPDGPILMEPGRRPSSAAAGPH